MKLLNYCLKLDDKVTENIDKYILLEKSDETLSPVICSDYGKLLAHCLCFDTEYIYSSVGYDENNKKIMILYGVKYE